MYGQRDFEIGGIEAVGCRPWKTMPEMVVRAFKVVEDRPGHRTAEVCENGKGEQATQERGWGSGLWGKEISDLAWRRGWPFKKLSYFSILRPGNTLKGMFDVF